jgi:hypothetical protein
MFVCLDLIGVGLIMAITLGEGYELALKELRSTTANNFFFFFSDRTNAARNLRSKDT